MVPKFAHLEGARSKLTEEEYGPQQLNQFNQFGNVVTYMCDDAYFFEDRSFEKYTECALKPGVVNVGIWRGYSGTILPLPKTCQRKFHGLILVPRS